MQDDLKPEQVIVAIFAADQNGQPTGFLGTGFFCDSPPVLATANHVLVGSAAQFLIAILGDQVQQHVAIVRARDATADLAILDVPTYTPPFAFPLGHDERIAFNLPVLSFEYGTTVTAGSNVELCPATRMGNITRKMRLDHLGRAGDRILELSFPALRGASGSPLVNAATREVWGVVIANVAHHLLPAQVETVRLPDGTLDEEIKYMLPQALAVNVEHLRALIKKAVPSAPQLGPLTLDGHASWTA